MFDNSEVYGVFVLHGCCSAISMWFMQGVVVQAVSEQQNILKQYLSNRATTTCAMVWSSSAIRRKILFQFSKTALANVNLSSGLILPFPPYLTLVCFTFSFLFRTAKLGISFGIVAVIIVLILFVCFAEKCMVSLFKTKKKNSFFQKHMQVIQHLGLPFRIMN